jgi:hypothetical protein
MFARQFCGSRLTAAVGKGKTPRHSYGGHMAGSNCSLTNHECLFNH